MTRTKLLLSTKLVSIGVGLFGGSLAVAASNLAFILEVRLTATVLGFMQLTGVLLCLMGITLKAMSMTKRNKWLTVVGITGIICSSGAAVLYGVLPLLEIMFGGNGHTVFDHIGIYFDTWQVPLIALGVLVIAVLALGHSVNLFNGQTKFQR